MSKDFLILTHIASFTAVVPIAANVDLDQHAQNTPSELLSTLSTLLKQYVQKESHLIFELKMCALVIPLSYWEKCSKNCTVIVHILCFGTRLVYVSLYEFV